MNFTGQPATQLARTLAAGGAAGLLLVACGPHPDSRSAGSPLAEAPAPAPQGELIVPLGAAPTPPGPASVQQEAAPPPPVAEVALAVPAASGATNDVLKLGFDTLSSFSYTVRVGYPEAGQGRPGLVTEDHIPPRVRELDGRRVVVTGFTVPMRTQGRGLVEFLLVRDPLSCCFGPSPLMNHWIHVTMPRGDFRPRIFRAATVTGTLRVGELRKAGSIQSIYRLAGEQVELVPEGEEPVVPPLPAP